MNPGLGRVGSGVAATRYALCSHGIIWPMVVEPHTSLTTIGSRSDVRPTTTSSRVVVEPFQPLCSALISLRHHGDRYNDANQQSRVNAINASSIVKKVAAIEAIFKALATQWNVRACRDRSRPTRITASTWTVAPNAPASWPVARSAAPRRPGVATPFPRLCLSFRPPQSVGDVSRGLSPSRRTLATLGVAKLSRRGSIESPTTANSASKISVAAATVERSNSGTSLTEQSFTSGCEFRAIHVGGSNWVFPRFQIPFSLFFLLNQKYAIHCSHSVRT